MLRTTSDSKRTSASVRTQAHALSLIRLLATKVDSAARAEIYRQDAARRGAHDYEVEFRQIEESDRKHIDWLRREIVRNVLQ